MNLMRCGELQQCRSGCRRLPDDIAPVSGNAARTATYAVYALTHANKVIE